MSDRATEIAGFLVETGWSDALQAPFAADFSPRRYLRLVKDSGERAVLMDADADQKTEEFILIDAFLRSMDLSAPDIFAADIDAGLVLMEDFGGRNVGGLLDQGAEALPLYRRAVDVLIHLHARLDKTTVRELDVPLYGGALFASQAEMFIDYYVPHALGRETAPDEAEAFRAAWKEVLRGIETLPQTLLLRDYMPDNLMDLPKREGVRSIGLLDFQDAGLGPIAYDLASLCEVVRRDPPDHLLDEMISYYYERAKPDLPLDELKKACLLLSAQRHMRILGVIARLVAKTGQREKFAYMPRIRHYLNKLLSHETLAPVQAWMTKHMSAA